jgi:hypothetical protein
MCQKKMEVVSGISNDATDADDTDVAMPGREEFSQVTMGHVAVIEVEAKEAKDQAQHGPPPVLQHLTIGINEVTRKPDFRQMYRLIGIFATATHQGDLCLPC